MLIKPNFNNNTFIFYLFLINLSKNKIPLYVIKLLFLNKNLYIFHKLKT